MHKRYLGAAFLAVLVGGPLPLAAGEPEIAAVEKWLDSSLQPLLEDYRWLHTHPEVSFQEQKTAEFIATQWLKAGYEVTTGVGGHGVVGVLKNGTGPTLMLRT